VLDYFQVFEAPSTFKPFCLRCLYASRASLSIGIIEVVCNLKMHQLHHKILYLLEITNVSYLSHIFMSIYNAANQPRAFISSAEFAWLYGFFHLSFFPCRANKLTLSTVFYWRLATGTSFAAFGNILFHSYIADFSIISAIPSRQI